MSKIGHYFSNFEITEGLLVSVLFSAFIYLFHYGIDYPLWMSILGLAALWRLLVAKAKVWFLSGAFTSLWWFWWIALSFKHYDMVWAMPLAIVFISLVYGLFFGSIAYIAESPCRVQFIAPLCRDCQRCNELHPTILFIKAFGLLGMSYIHPFGFDWFKPELVFVESYFGIHKWQFAVILLSVVLSIWKKMPLFLLLALFAVELPKSVSLPNKAVTVVSTAISVEEKWDATMQPEHFAMLLDKIDHAIDANKTLVILPESVFPIFLNQSQEFLDALSKRAEKISIVTGGLYADGEIPRNSAYIFTNGRILVANKVVLVPFGESNPLPKFLSAWVNEVFYDGAVDYIAADKTSDYIIDGIRYRNAICFEATSETLYQGKPKQMIVLSNNGWFTPSIEPDLQTLLLLYYNKKYGTTIYHSVNMSPSYVIQSGRVYPVFEE